MLMVTGKNLQKSITLKKLCYSVSKTCKYYKEVRNSYHKLCEKRRKLHRSDASLGDGVKFWFLFSFLENVF